MDFGHKHYVPILKSKEGERWALSHIPPAMRAHLTPLIEIHPLKKPPKRPKPSKAKNPRPPRPPKTINDHIDGICEALNVDWGPNHPFFVDTKWIERSGVPATIIADTFSALRRCGVQAIPVVHLRHDQLSIVAFRRIVAADGRGCLLRLAPGEFDATARIDAALRALALNADDVDLMLDYRRRESDIVRDVARLPYRDEWATLTVARGTMLESFKNERPHRWLNIDRGDWTDWLAAVQHRNIGRKPAFSDYTCRDGGPPASGGFPSVTIRYTCDTKWLVWVGNQVRYATEREMNNVSADLIQKDEYSGEDFSAGDEAIFDNAQPESGPGSAGQWVGWGVSHHLVFATQQVQALRDA
jgi:hypothetical protein